MGNTSDYLGRILKAIQSSESDIEDILDELWNEAFKTGREEGYDKGFKDGEGNVS